MCYRPYEATTCKMQNTCAKQLFMHLAHEAMADKASSRVQGSAARYSQLCFKSNGGCYQSCTGSGNRSPV
jgi:hypothetical protein